jgi:diketogulonate reductase-like aldo/keto reductase
MQTISLPDGTAVPRLGQGTWMMGEDPSRRAGEIAALREGVDLGMTLIDTAEMYAQGQAERVVGEAIAGRRDAVFLVSKAYPQNATRKRLPVVCESSLQRLGTERLDLYLLHWRGNVPLIETVEAMERLVEAGKILHWGVSNLDLADMEDLMAAGGQACATDQILFNLTRRGPERDLLPWLADRTIPVMAYSPVEQGRLVANARLQELAMQKGATAAQLALAWLLTHDGVMAVPKASTLDHVRENRAAADLKLEPRDIAQLDALFPKPRERTPLEML